MLVENRFDSRDALIEALREHCEERLAMGVDKTGRASFLVSGGSTPKPLYEALSSSDLPWNFIDVALVDERWVDEDHPASNTAFVHTNLLKNAAAHANFVAMKNSSATALDGLAECEDAYQGIGDHFDVCILGMGNDGHTASLFPHAEGLEAGLSGDMRCCAITAKRSEVTGDNVERMSLSVAGILEAKEIILLITGEEKWQTWEAAKSDGAVEDMPIRALLRQTQKPVSVYWAP